MLERAVRSPWGEYRIRSLTRFWCFVIVILVALLATRSSAQELARAVRVTADNDYFAFWLPPHSRPDEDYTQGARITWEIERGPAFARRLACTAHRACGFTYELGQEIYTPELDSEERLPGERPYAGWLYIQGSAVSATERSRRIFTTTLGVTGRASLAAQTQAAFHRLVPGFRRPLGWDRQLPTEPDAALRATAEWYVRAPSAMGSWADLVSTTSGVVGTLRTAMGAGVRTRLGLGLTHPWLADSHVHHWEGYVFVGAHGEWVGRDLFLDGATFHDSESVDREAFMTDWERGVALRFRRVGIEYRAVDQGRQYPTGLANHPLGSISLTYWTRR